MHPLPRSSRCKGLKHRITEMGSRLLERQVDSEEAGVSLCRLKQLLTLTSFLRNIMRKTSSRGVGEYSELTLGAVAAAVPSISGAAAALISREDVSGLFLGLKLEAWDCGCLEGGKASFEKDALREQFGLLGWSKLGLNSALSGVLAANSTDFSAKRKRCNCEPWPAEAAMIPSRQSC